MRAIVLGATLLALLPASAGAEQAVAGKPALRLASASPLKVRGLRFQPAERVRVRVLGEHKATKRVTANVRGSFVVGFQDISFDRCNAPSVVAVGSQGSRAALKQPEPLCPPRL
jgi:hypothetical protein